MDGKISCGSEKYAVLLEQEEREWHARYDALIDRKIQIFNRLLCMHTEESYALIEKLTEDAMTKEVEKRNTDYAFMVIFAQIFRAEKQAGEVRFLFDLADTLSDLIAIVQQMKFYLWELEFLQEEETKQLLLQFVQSYDMGPELLRNLIMIACVDKDRMRSVVSGILQIAL